MRTDQCSSIPLEAEYLMLVKGVCQDGGMATEDEPGITDHLKDQTVGGGAFWDNN